MSAQVTSNFPVISAKLAALPPALRPAVARGLRRGIEATRTRTQRNYLSGPRPTRLGVVSTRLRNSIAIAVQDDGKDIIGKIGTNVKYGAYHEFGFSGVQQVKAHVRVVKIFNRRGVQLTGDILARARGVIKDRAGTRVGYRRSMKTAMSMISGGHAGVQYVGAHSRRINYRGRPFIRPALQETEPTIVREVIREVEAEVARQNTP